MNTFSLVLIAIAVSLEYFSIAQRISFFTKNNYLVKTLSFIGVLLISNIIFISIGSSISTIVQSFFPINQFWLFIVLMLTVAVKYFFDARRKLPFKSTINPVVFRNLLGLVVIVGLNFLLVSLAIETYFSFSEIILYFCAFSLLFAFIGLIVGNLSKKLLNLKLDLFSTLIIVGLVAKHIIDYYLIRQ